jgi:hypothetical protein
MKEQDVSKILKIMQKFQEQRAANGAHPEEWGQKKEAEAIYEFMIHRGD